jgi:kynureninase
VALTHPRARALTHELIAHDVIVDYREPDVIRLGLSLLTTRFADIERGLQTLQSVSASPNRDDRPSV